MMVGENTAVTAAPNARRCAKQPKAVRGEETNTKKPHPSHTPQREGKKTTPEEGKEGINVFDPLALLEWMCAGSRT